MEPPIELDDASSSDGQQDGMRNHIHVEDYFNPIRCIKNDYMLRELEAERRLNEISENNKITFKAELHKIQGESGIQNMQQQIIIDGLLNQIQTPSSIFSGKKAKPLFPADPVLNQHLRSVEMSQQSRQAPASSSNNPESAHEPNKKLADLVTTMVFQQKHETTLYGGVPNQPDSSKHNYQTWDGEHLIFNILHKKGHLPND